MIKTGNFRSFFGLGLYLALNLLLAVTSLKAAEPLTPGKQLLSAKDFWDTTGQQQEHAIDEAVQSELRAIAADEQARPELRLRADKILCDLVGHTRLSSTFPAQHAARAMGAGMKYLEEHLGDATVRNFSPQLGFTHITISQKADDADGVWLLIESVEKARNGGINVRINPTTWKVTQVDHWGNVAP